MTKERQTVFVQNWTEHERGWGSRPDGFTIHIDRSQHGKYVADYYKRNHSSTTAPDEYTQADEGVIEIEVDKELFNRLKNATEQINDGKVANGIWGVEKYFSTTPMRPLRDGDVNWPKKKEVPKVEHVPTCPFCRQLMDSVAVEVIHVPPAPPWTNKIWSCSRHAVK